MDKKKGVKLGVCSLLVGLLALTACSKKKTTIKPTTKDPTTKTTTEKSSSKTTTKKPTTQKTTTEDLSTLVRLDVYIGDKKISDEYNTVDVVYGEDYDLESLVFVRGVKDNNTEVVLTDFDVETELTPTSNVGTYDVTISYGNLTPVVFSVKVNQKEIDASALEFDYTEAFTYDKESHSVALKNVPTGLVVSYETNEEAGNSKTNAGNYETIAVISVENDNYKIINYEGTINVLWKINKATIDMSNVAWDYTTPFTYDGNEKEVGVTNLPLGVQALYSGVSNAYDAGTYNVELTFNYDSTNYELQNVNIEGLEWVINKATIDMSDVHWNYAGPMEYTGEERTIGVIGLPEGVTASYSGDTSATNAGTYNVSVSFNYDSDNYNLENVTIASSFEWKISKATYDFTGVHWDYTKVFTYDGHEKSVEIAFLPYGINASYTNNKATDAGTYTATVALELENDNYEIINADDLDYSISWTINKAEFDLSETVWDFDSENPFIYDKEEHEIRLVNLPEGVKVTYTGIKKATNAGYYTVYVEIDTENDNYTISNYDHIETTFDWEIAKAKIDMSNVRWNYSGYEAFVYNGETHTIELINVPDEITSIDYYDNYAVNAGYYSAEAWLNYDYDNYELIDGPVDDCYETGWEIEKAKIDMKDVCWDYDPEHPFVYDGEEHTVILTNIPDEIDEVYYYGSYNGISADTYTAYAEIYFDDDNYELINGYDEYELDWQIYRCKLDLADVCWDYDPDSPFDYDGKTHTVRLLNVPDVIEVYYDDAEGTDADTYYAVAYLSYDYDNYYTENAPENEEYRIDWVINMAIAKVNTFEVESKTYDGEVISANVDVETDGDITVLYKGLYADDDAYTEEAPKDAGSYIAKLVVENNYNYTDIEEEYTVEFYILKKNLTPIKGPIDNFFITEYTGEEQTLNIEGYDSNLMYIVLGSNQVDEVKATAAGYYTFSIFLKDTLNYTWNGYDNGTSLVGYWVIRDNCFDGIYINGQAKGYDEFFNNKFKVYDYFKLILNNNKNKLYVNSAEYPSGFDYTLDHDGTLKIEVRDQYNRTIWYKIFNVSYASSISGIKIDDKLYENPKNITYKLGKDDESIELELVNPSSSYIYKLSKSYWGNEDEDIAFIDGKFTLDVTEIQNVKEYYVFEYDQYGHKYRQCASMYILGYSPIEELSSVTYNLASGETHSYVVNPFANNGSYEVYATYQYGYPYSGGTSIVLGLNIKFKDGFDDCTYKIIDTDTNEEYDFTEIKQIVYAKLLIYQGDEVIYSAPITIFNCNLHIDFEHTVSQMGEYDYYTCMGLGVVEFGCKVDNQEIDGEYNLVLDGADALIREYEVDGVFVEKLTFSKEIFGVVYHKELICDVIVSKNIRDYGTFSITYNNDEWSGSETCSIQDYTPNCFENTLSTYAYLNLNENSLSKTMADGYQYVGFEKIIINQDDPALRRLVLKITLKDSSNNSFDCYCLVGTTESFNGKLGIYGNSISIYGSVGKSRDIEVDSDEVEIDNVIRGDEVEIIFENDCRYVLYKDDEIIKESMDSETYECCFKVKEAGTYTLVMKNFLDEEKTFTFTFEGYFGNLLETSIGNDDDRNVLVLNFEKDDNIVARQISEFEATYMGYYGVESQEYIDNGKVDVNVSGALFGMLYKDKYGEVAISENVEEFDVLYDDNNNPYILVYFKESDYVSTIILYLTDKPQGKAIIDFGEDEKYGVGFDEYGAYGDFEILAFEETAYMFNRSNTTTTFTLSTDKVYDDYSYAIIMGDGGFMNVGLWDGTYTFAELDSMGYIYRVTDSTTLQTEVPLTFQGIIMVNEGLTGSDQFSFTNVTMFYINNVNVFNITIGDYNYYCDAEFAFEDYELTLSSSSNADDVYGDNWYYEIGALCDGYIYCIGEDEIDNIQRIGYDYKYKVKFDSSFGFDLYEDEYTDYQIIPDKDGYIYLPVVIGRSTGEYYCEFYLASYCLESLVYVQLLFMDELPGESLEIVNNVVIRDNIISGRSELEIEDKDEYDEVEIDNVLTIDSFKVCFEEKVNVELYYYEYLEKSEYNTDTFTFNFYLDGAYLLEITNFYGDKRIISMNITMSSDQDFLVVYAGESEDDMIVYNGDSNMYNLEEAEEGLVGYLGSYFLEYIENDKVDVGFDGYGLNFLYKDASLNTLLIPEGYTATFDVLYQDEVPYVEFYISTRSGAQPVILYVEDAPLGEIYLTIGESSYEIGTSYDDLGDIVKINTGTDDDPNYMYVLNVTDSSFTMDLYSSKEHHGYTNSLIYFNSTDSYFMSLWEDGADFDALEENGYLFRPNSPDSRNFDLKTPGIPAQFLVVPKGYTSVAELTTDLDADPLMFYLNRNDYIFDVIINNEEFYATNYSDVDNKDLIQVANTEYVKYTERGTLESITYYLGKDYLKYAYDDYYPLFLCSNFSNIFYLDSECTDPLEIYDDGYTELEIQSQGSTKYICFYYNIGYGLGGAEVKIYFEDIISYPVHMIIDGKAFDIAYPTDVISAKSFYVDEDVYWLPYDGNGEVTFTFDEYYDDYSYALIYHNTLEDRLLRDELIEGMTVEEIDARGRIIKPNSQSDLTKTLDYITGGYGTIIVLPLGTKATDVIKLNVGDINFDEYFHFELQLRSDRFNIEIEGNNYYLQEYDDYTRGEHIYVTNYTNADMYSENGLYGSMDSIIFLVGDAEQDKIEEGKYTFKITTKTSKNLFYKAPGFSLSIPDDDLLTLDVQQLGDVKYVRFYVINSNNEYIQVDLYLNDEIPH